MGPLSLPSCTSFSRCPVSIGSTSATTEPCDRCPASHGIGAIPNTGDWYWDATNLVYSRAFHSALLWGPAAHAWSLSQLNNESAGDIIEICLALAFRHDAYHEFRDRVEEMVRCTIAANEKLPELERLGAATWADAVDDARVGYRRAGWRMR